MKTEELQRLYKEANDLKKLPLPATEKPEIIDRIARQAGFMEACERIQKWVNEHEDYVPQEFNEEIEKMREKEKVR